MGAELLFAGACFFPTANIFVCNFLRCITRDRLTKEDYYLITEKCVSSLQAILSVMSGAVIIHTCQNNIMTDRHWLATDYAYFGLPYFVYDMWAMYLVFREKNQATLKGRTTQQRVWLYIRGDPAMLIHHIVMPCIFFPIIIFFRQGLGDFFVGVLYMMETAIPFISIRFILVQLDLKNSLLYIIAGLQMIFAFFVSRILVFPYLYWKYAVHAEMSVWQVPRAIPVKCNVSCGVILVLQLYWLGLMVRGAVRVFYKIHTGDTRQRKD